MLAVAVVQSTYCDNLRQHCETVGRTVHVVNLGESPSERLVTIIDGTICNIKCASSSVISSSGPAVNERC